MKGQKGGRVGMPIEYYHGNIKGPFTSNPAPATLARGMVDSSGCLSGPLLVGGKRTRRRRRHKSKQTNNVQMNIVNKPRKPRKRSKRRRNSRK